MKSQKTNVILIIISILLSILFYYPFGKLYELIINSTVTGWFWGPDPLVVAGIYFAIVFIFPFTLSFGSKGKYYYMAAFMLLDMWIVWGHWDGVMQDLITFLSGLILGYFANLLYLKVLKKSK